VSRLRRAFLSARLAFWCEIRGHEYRNCYSGGQPGRLLSGGHRLPTVRMRQCVRCGDFGGYSNTGWEDPSST
jgi:hypothetical protein